MTELDKKINDLKEFIKQKTDQGTANYLGKEIREICGIVETEQCNIDFVSNCDNDTKDLIEHTKRVIDLIRDKSGIAVKVLGNRINKKLEQLK